MLCLNLENPDMLRKVLLLAYFLALLNMAKAQPALGILSDSLFVSDSTVAYGAVVFINYFVKNTGNAVFSGSLKVQYSVNNVFQGDLDTTTLNAFLNPGEAAFFTTSSPITPDIYAIGDNIVVIWPVSLYVPAPTTDSGQFHIWVDTILGNGPPLLKEQIRVFYDPLNLRLSIDYGDLEKEISDVRVYSLPGQPIYGWDYAVKEFSLAENSPQLFLLRIQTRKGEAISFKILRK